MTLWLKQSTAKTVKLGPFVDSTDGATAETGLTISQADIRVSKNGGAFAQTNNAAGATHDENGYYGVPLDTTDTGTLGTVRVAIAESGALPVWETFLVMPANVYDSFILGTDDLDVQVAGMDAGTVTAAAVATGAIDADAIASNAITAAKVADATIDAATFAAGAIDATAIATDAITAAKIAADAIGASEIAANAITSSELADGAITAAKFGAGAIDATAIATGAIDADAIAADAIGASELAADAVAEIADAVWDEAIVGHVGAGSFGEEVQAHALTTDVTALNDLSAADVNAEVDTALADYDGPTKAELDSGLAALNDPTAAAIADAVWDEDVVAAHNTADTAGALIDDLGTPGDFMADVSALSTAAALATVDTNVDSILADTGTDGVIVASINTGAVTADAIAANAIGASEIAAGAIAADAFAAGAIDAAAIATDAIDADALAADAVAEIWETALTEAYAADGAAGTAAQIIYLILQKLTEFGISGTTLTVKKLDGSTGAATFTLDNATNPTSITRAT